MHTFIEFLKDSPVNILLIMLLLSLIALAVWIYPHTSF